MRFAYRAPWSTPRSSSSAARFAIPVSKTRARGAIPRSLMRSASATIVSGALTLALVRKLSEPSVRLAMSGLRVALEREHVGALLELRHVAPARAHADTASGRCSRIAGMNSA